MLNKLKSFFKKRGGEKVIPNQDLTLGVPLRMLGNNTGEQADEKVVYGISKEELLTFLEDNNFEPTNRWPHDRWPKL